MNLPHLFESISVFYALYFVVINCFYLIMNYSSMFYVFSSIRWRGVYELPKSFDGFDLGISILVPAHNECDTIISSIKSVMNLEYPEFEIIVINDGSTDGTLELLIQYFELKPLEIFCLPLVASVQINQTYRSKKYPQLTVLDKENSGKSDCLNAGISYSKYSLFCSVDSDSILSRDSLKKTAQRFLEEPNTVAVGGMVCISEGCVIEDGFLKKVDLPRQWLPLLQVVEYWRAFIFGRAGWTPFNTVPIISGAFSLFHKQTVIDVGGYSTDTVGEDMELVLRIHLHMRKNRRPYSIVFIPDSICWTDCPRTLKALQRQRIRWQRGLLESLWANRELLFLPSGGMMSWFTIPYLVFFEAIEPFVQVFGHVLALIGMVFGYITFANYLYFSGVIMGISIFLSINAIFIEELSVHSYEKFSQFLKLFFMCIVENIGFRQINTFWRLVAFFSWIFNAQIRWGKHEAI